MYMSELLLFDPAKHARRRSVYAQYMQSECWFSRRTEAIKRDSGKCHDCGGTDQLQGHHLRYPVDLFKDDCIANIVTLCSECHMLRHAIGVWGNDFDHVNQNPSLNRLGLQGRPKRLWHRVPPATPYIVDIFKLGIRRIPRSLDSPFSSYWITSETIGEIIDNWAEAITYFSINKTLASEVAKEMTWTRATKATQWSGTILDQICKANFDKEWKEDVKTFYAERRDHHKRGARR